MTAPSPHRSRLRDVVLIAALLALAPRLAIADPSASGDSGLIAMPDARTEDDGTVLSGLAFSDPYAGIFASMTFLPGLEATFIYQRLDGVEVTNQPDYGSYKDKQFQLKWTFLDETARRPALAFGARDIHGTQRFPAQYLVASKRFGAFDASLGYGGDRLDGLFGGLSYRPAWDRGRWRFLVEYDANDYAGDFAAAESGAIDRDSPINVGIGYDIGWGGARITSESGAIGGVVYLRFPFGQPDLTPKTKEPSPLRTAEATAPPATAWVPRGDPARTLADQLYRQDFDRVSIAIEDRTLSLSLTNTRISHMGRAVGRAARTALLYGPSDVDSLRITYSKLDLPIAVYSFSDVATLRDYFAGRATPEQLGPTVKVTYASPAQQAQGDASLVYSLDALPIEQVAQTGFKTGEEAESHLLFLERTRRDGANFGLKPFIINGFFNDLGGAFRYDVFAAGYYTQRYAPGLFGTATVRLTLLENVSDVTTVSDSTLPHVRSDIALYKQGGDLKVENLFLAKYAQLDEQVYARFSAGLYDEMFAAAGGQFVYLPANARWAADLDLEYARQRDFDGFGFLDYDTVTAIAAFHYRFPDRGITATVRGGVFLAGDEGYRFELRRRLRSGVNFGFWYTVTNGNDITGPGAPGDPYYDKGVFITLPLRMTLPRDTQASGGFSLSPWARDVGQMLRFPTDVYRVIESEMFLNTTDYNPLSLFGR
jgi:hypothetical protein